MDNLDNILEEILKDNYLKIIKNEEKLLKNLGSLSLKECNTLDAIALAIKNKNNTANNIAKILGITPGTLTTNLDRLMDKGLIYKEKSIDDKRLVLIYLTPDGCGVRRKRENAHRKIIANAIENLSTPEKVALMGALNKLEF